MQTSASQDRTEPGRGRVVWRHSLRTRLMFWASLTGVLLLGTVAAVFYVAIRSMMVNDAHTEMRGLARQTAQGLEATMDSVQVSGMALSGSVLGLAGQPINLRSLLMSTVASDPDIFGAMLIIEPGRLGEGHPGFTWYIRRSVTGFRESSVEDLGYDYRVMPWYIRTVTSPRGWWSEPYANAATGNTVYVTYNQALRLPSEQLPGAVIGMVSLDVPLARLSAQLKDIPSSRDLRPMLLSPQRLYAVHPDPKLALGSTLDTLVEHDGRTDLAPLLQALREGKGLELEHVTATGAGGTTAGESRYTVALPLQDTGWSFALSMSQGYLLARLERITFWVLLVGLAGMLLCLVMVRRYSALIAGPIEDLTDSARHFAGGEFDYPLAHTGREDEVGVMARAFDGARASIKRQMAEIEDMAEARQKLESELAIASDIQQAMLPPDRQLGLGRARLGVAAALVPAKAVGGDFYHFSEPEPGRLWFVVGDVSDKGVPAALFMARTMTVLEVAAKLGGSPDRALHEAARHLVDGNDTCMFATVLCGIADLATGELALANAGHEPPVWLHADGRRELLRIPGGAPLGIEAEDTYPVWNARLQPGDTLLLYSDGVNEAFNRALEAFGEDRLLAALDPAHDAAAQCEALVAAVRAFAGDAEQSDDITVLALRYGAA